MRKLIHFLATIITISPNNFSRADNVVYRAEFRTPNRIKKAQASGSAYSNGYSDELYAMRVNIKQNEYIQIFTKNKEHCLKNGETIDSQINWTTNCRPN